MERHGSSSCIYSSETIEQLLIRQLVFHQLLCNGVPLKTKLPRVFITQDDKLLRQKDQSAKNSMKEIWNILFMAPRIKLIVVFHLLWSGFFETNATLRSANYRSWSRIGCL